MDDQVTTLKEVMNAISESGLTLNPSNYSLGNAEINFWGMIYEEEGIRPDSATSTRTRLHHPTKNQRRAHKLFMHNAIK